MAIVPGSIQQLTKSIAWFVLNDPILLKGQTGIEEDDLLTAPKYKIGNGVDLWSVLPYANSGASGLNAVLTVSNTTLGKNIVVSSGDKILFNGGGGSVFEAFTDGTGIFNFYDQTTATTAYTIVSSVFQFGTGYQVSMDNLSVLGISILGGDVNVGLAGVTDGTLVFKNATNANELTIKSGVTAANFSLTMPTTDSTGTQALVSNGSGVLSWASIPAGGLSGLPANLNFDNTTGGYDIILQDTIFSDNSTSSINFFDNGVVSRINMLGQDEIRLMTTTYSAYLTEATGLFNITGGLKTSGVNTLSNVTASRALTTNASKEVTASATTDVELGYVSGVTSAIQTQLNNKQALNANLTSLSGLTYASTSFVKMTAAGTFALDTNTYLTSVSLAVGTTPVTGGTAGRILFEGAGNILNESINLVWNNTNSQLSLLGAGTASLPTVAIGGVDIGMWSSAANTLSFATLGVNRVNLDGSSLRSVTNGGFNMSRAAGSLTQATYAYQGNVNYGDFLNGTTIARTINGTQIHCTNSTGFGIFNTAPTSALHINKDQNSVTQNDANGILLANSTAATAGLQSISPALVLQGNGWKTNATAGSQGVRFRIDVLPVQGASSPTSTLQFASSINGGAYTLPMTLTSAGILNISNAVIAVGSVQGSSIFGTSAAWFGASASLGYRTTNAGGSLTPSVGIATVGTTYTTAGAISTMFSGTSNQIIFAKGNGTNAVMAASIGLTNLVNTAGSEAGDLGFYTQTAGAVAALRLTIGATSLTLADAVNLAFNTTTGTKIGTATTQKLSFWNATPIVQITTGVAAATFTANTSLIANDTATFDGYTIGQVVKALRNLGLLA